MQSVRSSLEYFKEGTGEGVERVYLVGGSGKLKGIDKYFSDELGIPVWIGESALLRNVASLEYIEAIGLALRGLDDSWEETDPVFYVKPSSTRDSSVKKEDEQDADGKNRKEDVVLATPVELRQIKKLQFEKKVLLGILVLGIGLVSTAEWYRDYRRATVFEEAQRAQLERQAIHIRSFEAEIPIAVKSESYSEDRISGRLAEDIREGVENVDDERELSLSHVKSSLLSGEFIWNIPMKEDTKEGEGGKKSVTYVWLVYTDADAVRLFTKEVEKAYGGKTKVAVNAIEKIDIKENFDDASLFYLVGKVYVSVEEAANGR